MTFDQWWYINSPVEHLDADDWFNLVKEAWEASAINTKEEME